MPHLLIRHQVADFTKWKKVYNDHAGARQSAGLTEVHLLQGIDDPNEVMILFSVAEIEKAKALAVSDDLRAAMQDAGVIGKPELGFFQ